MSERYVPHHYHNPADCEGCVDAERESDRLCAEITALKAKLAAAETGECAICGKDRGHHARFIAGHVGAHSFLAPPPPAAGRMGEVLCELPLYGRRFRLLAKDRESWPVEVNDGDGWRLWTRESGFGCEAAVVLSEAARRAREEEGRKNRALLEIQSQCAGHADEFSRRVWQIACAALEGRTT